MRLTSIMHSSQHSSINMWPNVSLNKLFILHPTINEVDSVSHDFHSFFDFHMRLEFLFTV